VRAFTLSVCVALIAGISSCAARAPTPLVVSRPFQVRGDVSDSKTGEAVSVATIRVSRSGRHAGRPESSIISTRVDSLGRFAFVLSESGRFYVTALAIGYRPTTVRIDLPRDTARTFALRLLGEPVYVGR
jgi:hypothetical protein